MSGDKRDDATNGAHAAPFVRVRGARLRHNHGMRSLFFGSILAAAALLTGCERSAQPGDPGGASPASPVAAMEFRGERPCVDCDRIEAWLRLEQEGAVRRYRLTERYRGIERERQFEDEGEWSAEGDLLRLRSRGGGERVYARLASGALQARSARGLPLPAAADDVLAPVSFDTMR